MGVLAAVAFATLVVGRDFSFHMRGASVRKALYQRTVGLLLSTVPTACLRRANVTASHFWQWYLCECAEHACSADGHADNRAYTLEARGRE